MNLFQREFEQLQDFLKEWPAESALWVHINGPDGIGKRYFVQQALKQPLRKLKPLWTFNFDFFPLKSRNQLIEAVQFISRRHAREFQRYLRQFPNHLAESIRHRLQDNVAQEPEKWESYLLLDFLGFLVKDSRGLIVFQRLFERSDEINPDMMRLFRQLLKLPLVIVTTGTNKAPKELVNPETREIILSQCSVRETERLVAHLLKTDAMSSRLITNHLFVKSAGNLQKVRFMLEAYYRPLLEGRGSKQHINNDFLQKMRVSADYFDIFHHLVSQFPDAEKACLAFLSHLKDPLPLALWQKILSNSGASRRIHRQWLQRGFIHEIANGGQRYVVIDFPHWQEYLQKNVPIYLLEPILNYLGKSLSRRKLPRPLEVSGLFFDMGDFQTAIRTALREADALAADGDTKRALERYAFLRRNVAHFPKTRVSLVEVLHSMGELQFRHGLYENAFESFREMRDRLKRDQVQEWVQTSLQMANALFQMDLHSEAHYLIKDLRYKKNVPAFVHAFSHVLNGELEQNFGRPEYALKSFNNARTFLPKMRNDSMILNLFSILKERYLGMNAESAYLKLLNETREALSAASPYQPVLQLETIRYQMKQQNYQAALSLGVELLRKSYLNMTPRMHAQLRLYLSEIYGFYGKWYLSRSHLKHLLSVPLLTPTEKIHAQVLINLGIVEKELNRFGAAVDHLQDALTLCKEHHLTRQVYEIKIHLGHTYLLTHSFIRAYDHLVETLRWAEENQDNELMLSAMLFLASYNMQQNHLNIAARYLEKSEQLLDHLQSLIDRLNFSYYKTLYLIKSGQLDDAELLVRKWLKQSKGILKFENLARLMLGKILSQKGLYSEARKYLSKSLEIHKQFRQPALEVQILRELSHIMYYLNDAPGAEAYATLAQKSLERLLDEVGDEILRRQMEESREYETLIAHRSVSK